MLLHTAEICVKMRGIMKNKWYKRWRCLIAHRLYRTASAQTKRKIDSDAARYIAESPLCQGIEGSGLSALDGLLLSDEASFRSVFYYRCRSKKMLCYFSRLFLPEHKEIEIYGDIEQGLLLSHTYMVVHPEKAGKNLRVEPGVVIGVNRGKFPTIGDNVSIGANAVVIGGITIGDNVRIEPGSVVTKNVAGNTVWST